MSPHRAAAGLAKARKLHPLTARARERMERCAARDGGMRCVYCKAELPIVELGLDHVVPKSRGGSDGLHNRVLACPGCDSLKGNRTPQEWKRGTTWGVAAVDHPRQRPTVDRPARFSPAQEPVVREKPPPFVPLIPKFPPPRPHRVISDPDTVSGMDEPAPPTDPLSREQVAAAVQDAWDTHIADTGCFPGDFTLGSGPDEDGNPTTTISLAAGGNWITWITDGLNQAIAASGVAHDLLTADQLVKIGQVEPGDVLRLHAPSSVPMWQVRHVSDKIKSEITKVAGHDQFFLVITTEGWTFGDLSLDEVKSVGDLTTVLATVLTVLEVLAADPDDLSVSEVERAAAMPTARALIARLRP